MKGGLLNNLHDDHPHILVEVVHLLNEDEVVKNSTIGLKTEVWKDELLHCLHDDYPHLLVEFVTLLHEDGFVLWNLS